MSLTTYVIGNIVFILLMYLAVRKKNEETTNPITPIAFGIC